MNKPTNRSTEGMLLTIQQAAEVSNLGVATTRPVSYTHLDVYKRQEL